MHTNSVFSAKLSDAAVGPKVWCSWDLLFTDHMEYWMYSHHSIKDSQYTKTSTSGGGFQNQYQLSPEHGDFTCEIHSRDQIH